MQTTIPITPNIITPDMLSYLTILQRLPNAGYKYCIKTGKKLNKIQFDEIADLIKIHGISKTITVCGYLQKSISTEWILTDEMALRRLANRQPVEYFIYAVTNLIPVFLNAEHSDVISANGNLCLDANLQTKVNANEFMQRIPFQQLLTISELTRLILSSNRPHAMHEMFKNISLRDITSSRENLLKFQLVLKSCYTQIKSGYYDDNLVKDRDRIKKQLFLKQKTLLIKDELEREIAESLEQIEIEKLINPDNQCDELIKLKMAKTAKLLKRKLDIEIGIKKERSKQLNKSQKFAGIKWADK